MKVAELLGAVREDAAFAVRSLARVPVYTATVLVTLALAIGGVSAVFSVLYAVVLKPLPYPDPDRLAVVHGNFIASHLKDIAISPRELLDVRERATSFRGVAALATGSLNVTGHGEAQHVAAGFVSAEYFDVLGAPPVLGRAFLPEEDDGSGAHVALLGASFHARAFGRDPAAVGQSIELDGATYTIVGVLPPAYERSVRGLSDVGTSSTERIDVWVPLTFTPEQADARARSGRFLTAIARLAPGVTFEQAAGEVQRLGAAFAEEHPAAYPRESGWSLSLRTLHALSAGNAATVLELLLGAVLLLLLAACANVVSLALARLATRRREIAVRAALGATDGRIVLQFLVESLLLSVAGGALGLVVARIGMDSLVMAHASTLVRGADVAFHAPVVGFAFGVCVVTGVVFGVVPAYHASRLHPAEGMREGGRATGASAARLRSALVVAQVAVALVLLVSAGTLLQKLVTLTRTSPGFETNGIYAAQLAMAYEEPDRQRRLGLAALERIRAVPGVEAAGLTSIVPLRGWSDWIFDVEGVTRPPGGVTLAAQTRIIAGDYFATLGMSVVEGRAFRDGDDQNAPDVAVVNRAFVQRFLDGADPLTRRIVLHPRQLGPGRTFAIVGVVEDTHDMGLDRAAQPFLFIPFAQLPTGAVGFVARAPTLGGAALAAMRGAVAEADATQPLFAMASMSEIVDESLGPHRFTLLLFGAFAALALALATLGIYGITSYGVAQRTQELAVRMAMGADGVVILRLVLGQALRLVGAGLLVGAVIAVAAGQVLASLMFGLRPSDPVALAAIGTILALAGLVAAWVPARRASALELANALRTE